MAYPTTTVFSPKLTSAYAGAQPILTTSTTQNHPLGTVVHALDTGTAQCGEATYVYGKGVASTAAGDLCTYDPKGAVTARAVHSTAARGPVGVAMSANVASQYGWYAVAGVVPVAAGSVAAAAPVFITSTAGTIDDAVVSTDKADGATTQSSDSSGFAYVILSWPCANGNG